MKLLALETSTTACSVALQTDGQTIERHVVQAKAHTRLLLPMINEIMAEAGCKTGDLDAIVLGNGPGSFIGMRISASVAQGLAFGHGLQIVPVSSLAAVAAEAFRGELDKVLVAQDAHMEEVYLARFRRGDQGLPLAEGDTVLQPVGPIDLPEEAEPARWPVAGGGWSRYPELLQVNRERISNVIEPRLPRARFLLPAGAAAWRAGEAVAPRDLAPFYLRSRVAALPRADSRSG